MEPRVYRFNVGAIECLAVSDSTGPALRTTAVLRPDIPPAELEQALREHRLDPQAIPIEFTSLVVKTPGRLLLADTGHGPRCEPGQGKLVEYLRAVGIEPEEVDTVVISHAHGDHIDGALTPEGRPAFPRARYVLGRPEWAACAGRTDPAIQYFRTLGDRLWLVDEGDELAPGVRVVAIPGHTPGQIAVEVTPALPLSPQGGEGRLRGDASPLLFVGDLLHFLIEADHPDWCTVWDQDPPLAAASRRRILGRAAADGTLVMGSHFPWPSVGRVAPKGEGWEWRPIDRIDKMRAY